MRQIKRLTYITAHPRLRRLGLRRHPRRDRTLSSHAVPPRGTRRPRFSTSTQRPIIIHNPQIRLIMVSTRGSAAPGSARLDSLPHPSSLPRLPRRTSRFGRDPTRFQTEEAGSPITQYSIIHITQDIERIKISVALTARRR